MTWVAIVTGCLLILLVIIIALMKLKRNEQPINWTMLILVALGVVLILGSQYSKVSVLDLIKLEGKVDKLENAFTSSEKKVDKLIIYTQASTAEIDSLGKALLQTQQDLNSLREAFDKYYKQQSQPTSE